MLNTKVVIIDEDQEVVEELERISLACGYSPIVVKDPRLATEIVIESKPDVVLLELKMLSKNGFEIADEINRVFESESISIIAMTAFIKYEHFSLMNLCGINRYLKKPFYPLDVISVIEDVIALKQEVLQRI